MPPQADQSAHVAAFITAACVPRATSHASGTLDEAQSILDKHPEVARANIHTAAILGDDAEVRRLVELKKDNATAKGGPHDWDALTHLCFSRYLRLDPSRSDGFVRAATALLDAGANANTGWYEHEHEPQPEWEGALYGAAGIAHHAALTRLLVEHGADPNDGETTYHTPEGYDNEALTVLLDTGKLTDDSLTTMLVRKADWHDYDGIKLVLDKGISPNYVSHWGNTPLHHAIIRDNALRNIELMLDHGGDPNVLNRRGRTAGALAARCGRSDVLDAFERRGLTVKLEGVDRLIAACAKDDTDSIKSIVRDSPALVEEVIRDGSTLLAQFAGTENTPGVKQLLDLGVDIGVQLNLDDSGYWDLARDSTALHVAAWRASHSTVRLLIDRGADVNAKDGSGRTPLMLAVRACVDSYWTEFRSPESVKALLDAGASVDGVKYPSGYAEVDQLLQPYVRG